MESQQPPSDGKNLNPEQKKPYRYDAIVVLGANMVIDPETGKPHFPTIMPQRTAEGEQELVVAGKSRAIAAAQAYKDKLAPVFIVVSGTQKGMQISNARGLTELITRYKVPRELLVVLEGGQNKNNTMGNAEMLTAYLSDKPEIRNIGILTNKWHAERAMTMLEENHFFHDHGITLHPLIVENLLKERSPLYENWEQEVDKTDAMQNRKKAEKQGIQDLKDSSYKR